MGVIDELSAQPTAAMQVAAALKLEAEPLVRLLRGLAVLGIVSEHPNEAGLIDRFSLTTAGLELHSSSTSACRSYALLVESQYLPAFAQMEAMLRYSQNPFEAATGQPVCKYRKENAAAGSLFNQWLHRQSSTLMDDLITSFDFSRFATIADVG